MCDKESDNPQHYQHQAVYQMPQMQMQHQQPVMMNLQQQRPVQMMVISQESHQASKDLQDLKDLQNANQSQSVYCPMCEHRGETTVRGRRSHAQWLTCLGLSCIGLNAGCCLIPFCVQEMKDKVHHCGNCNHPLGKKAIINLCPGSNHCN